ncbi:fasciclin domain-containing protein [Granulosicoccus antarcticus]|uniref:FAS1 domain-containing protein n=1 Tax=Granulosicoccus antarcticus IMCC3135 TaxID=1192854 RepID=A0A2Z2NSJ6_9GAMM|nr:fasciclin domain-containing protein [Granulosicoccus antarcticus]ASJ71710.1 hypothetical protein IMCC3135_08035 [Granulosicoccus antarcticus IMCC3135]
MIKKYFAMTIIAASVSLAACSDDDDDDGLDPVDPGPIAVTAEGTAYDLIAASADHTTLLSMIDTAGLDATLDAEAATFTVFAPNDTAFANYDAAVAAGVATTEDDTDDLTPLADFTEAQVSRILMNHVVSGSVETLEDAAVLNTLAAADDSVDPALVAQTLTASISAEGVTSVMAIGGEAVAVDATMVGTEVDAVEQDIVHSVGAILMPSDLPSAEEVIVDPVDPGNGEGGEVATGAFATLVGSDYTTAVAALDAAYGAGTFDNAAWTLFLPSDAVLAAAEPAVASLTSAEIDGHLHTTALDEAALAAVVDGSGTILSASSTATPATIAITTDADGNTLVGGFTVTYLGTVAADDEAATSGGAQVYAIDGILPAAE